MPITITETDPVVFNRVTYSTHVTTEVMLDFLEEVRKQIQQSLEEIRRRGQWSALSPVQRYERHAALLRSLNRMAAEQQASARAAELAIVATLQPLLRARYLS